MSNKKIEFFYFFSFFFAIFFFIQLTPGMLPKFEPDSYSYINFTDYRRSLYGIIFEICEDFKFDIILIQKLVLTLSLLALYFSLYNKTNFFLSSIFITIVLVNFYYTGFSKTILAESLLFSFINFSIVALFRFEKNKHQSFLYYLLTGFCFGFIFAIKSIGLVFGLLFLGLILFLKKEKNFNFFISLMFGFLFCPIVEQVKFFSKNNQRSSVLPQAVIGKVFMLSGKENFNHKHFPTESNKLLNEASIEFYKIQSFLKQINNPFLKADLTADYEVVAQYQFYRKEMNSINSELSVKNKKFEDGFIEIILKNYLSDYLNMTFYHYIGLWSVGSKHIFLQEYLNNKDIELPFPDKLKSSSGNIKSINNNLLFFSLTFFILLLITFSILTLISILLISKKKYREYYFYEISFCIITQIYLITVSFLNVSTPRYLMPVFPIIIMVIMLYIYKVSQFIKKDSVDFSK